MKNRAQPAEPAACGRRLRAFAAAWTAFTALAAPALLVAQEPASATPPAGGPAQEAEPAPPRQPAEPQQPQPAPAQPAPESPEEVPAPVEPAAEQPAPAPAPAAEGETEASKPAAGRKRKRSPRARRAASASVTIADFAFSPSSVTVNVGDTVTWTNDDSVEHSATGDEFDTGLLAKGESGSHTFDSTGKFSYVCTPHPYMKGTVTVQGSSAGDDDSDSGGTAGQDDSDSSDSDSDSSSSSDDSDTTDGGTSLADTGAEPWALALLGTGLLSLGFAVRRRSESA